MPATDDDIAGNEKVRKFNEQLVAYSEWSLQNAQATRKGRAGFPNIDTSVQIPIAGTVKWQSGYPDPYMLGGRTFPLIKMDGKVTFCFDFNGNPPSGNYVVGGTYSDAPVLKVLANFHAYTAANPGKLEEAYFATQFAIWQYVTTGHIKLSEFIQWDGNVSSAVLNAIFNGTTDYYGKTYTLWVGGAQDLITFEADNPKNELTLKIIKKMRMAPKLWLTLFSV